MLELRREFERQAGFELEDPFDRICEMLGDSRPFSFSRFGDGELNAVFGLEAEAANHAPYASNCDGHEYFPSMRRRLKEILTGGPEYMMGLLPLALVVYDSRLILSIAPGVRWVLANSLHLALAQGRLGSFFDALDGRDVWLVGPEHLAEPARRMGWDFLQVRSRNCWVDYEETSQRLRDSMPESEGVLLLCASMMSNVLVDDLHAANPRNTYIDVGSVLDPFGGVKSRIYHESVEADSLSRMSRRLLA